VALMILVRISGKRTVGQFTPFDLLVVMLISEAVSNSLSGKDESVGGGLIIATTLILLAMLTGFLSARNAAVEKVVEGVPVLLGRDGKVFDAVLLRHRVSQAEVERALRENDCDQSEMGSLYLEPDGEISVQKKKKKG
jgi:uncharacterized membrane protein YcaP (DUF421 family)